MSSTTIDDERPYSIMDTTTTQSDTHDPRPITPPRHSRSNYEWQKSIRKSFHPARRDGTMECGSNAHRHDRRMQSVLQTIRNDAAELEKKTVELDAKKSAVLSTVNRLLRFMSRVDALTSRVEALEAKRKADEAVQRKLDEEPIELPPDLDRPQGLPPSPIGDETHTPGGELHALAPKDQEPSSELPEPPLETEGDAGGVPLSYGNVPTSYVR